MDLGPLPRSLCTAFFLVLSACSSTKEEQAPAAPVAFDGSFLDTSAEPCTDFYQFACGTWIAQHTATPGYVVQRFANGDYREDIYFTQLVDAMASGDPGLRTAQSYYAGCLNAARVPSAAPGRMGTQMQWIDGMTTLADLPVALGNLQRSGVRSLLAASPQIDPGNPTSYMLGIRDAGWSLPSSQSYLDPDLAVAYKGHMAALALAAESAGVNVALDPELVFAFERDLAALGGPTSDPTIPPDPVADYNPTDAAGLASALPGFDWGTYGANLGFRSITRANVVPKDFLPSLSGMLAVAGLGQVKQYLEWRVLETDADHVDKPMNDEEFRFHRTVLEGRARDPANDPFLCLLDTRSWFGFELARHYVQNFVPTEVKPAATGMVESVRSAMRANFSQVSWLDDATRTAAQQKLDLLLPKVGYPDTWPTSSVAFGAADSYLDMAVELVQSATDNAATRLMGPVDRTEFWASPEITNAFYSPDRNDITIPVAVLQAPFFDGNRPAAFSYGALGAVIGHELTHAFDSNGRNFDGLGTLTDWWTPRAASEFQTRARCLIDQYSGYEALPGLNVSGQATVNENIADLGGLRLAYAAFEASGPGKASGQFNAEEQFFLSYAQLWCSSVSDRAAAERIAIDSHSPPKFRVNGVVRNLPEFAQAFACPAGTPLAPAERCDIW
jgi:putative endopeptidase